MRTKSSLHTAIKSAAFSGQTSASFPLFVALVFLITLGDAIIAYTVPVFLENALHNTFMVGLVMSASSIAGLIYDLVASERLSDKPYGYFVKMTILFAILLPVTLIFLPSFKIFVLLAMIFWGIYYETKIFAEFHFIDKHVPKSDYAKSWGLISVNNSLAYLLGPLIATFIIVYSLKFSLSASLIFFVGAYIVFIFLNSRTKKRRDQISDSETESERHSFLRTMKVWATLMGKVWPLWLFTLAATLVDASFWSVGVLFAEELKATDAAGGFLLTAYMIPPVFMGFAVPKISAKFGKKRTSFISALVASALISLFGFLSGIYLLLLLVFISSVFLSLATPALYAAYEDYVSRLGKFRNDMIGLEQSAVSIGYIIGPPLAGGLAVSLGAHKAFATIGLILLVISIMCLLVVPKKIKMPQKELIETAGAESM